MAVLDELIIAIYVYAATTQQQAQNCGQMGITTNKFKCFFENRFFVLKYFYLTGQITSRT
jgi:hypothetical protein